MNEDLILVRRVQAGDNSAFDLLVLKYQHKVASLIARYVRDSDEVQDVSQETFIRAYRGLHNFREDSSFYTWLYKIATNTAKNHIIKQSRRPACNGSITDELNNFEDGLQDISDPQGEFISDEIEAKVKDTINAMPGKLQKTTTLRELSGLSYEEIASVMKCPIGTVRSRISRSREVINEQLQPLLDNSLLFD